VRSRGEAGTGSCWLWMLVSSWKSGEGDEIRFFFVLFFSFFLNKTVSFPFSHFPAIKMSLIFACDSFFGIDTGLVLLQKTTNTQPPLFNEPN
jgi:hypothetical protein